MGNWYVNNACIYIHSILLTKNHNVDAGLDASEKVIYGNEPSSEMLASQSQKPEWAKTDDARESYLSRSQEIKLIRTLDSEFPTIFNRTCAYITFKHTMKHRQLSCGYLADKHASYWSV